MARALLRLVNGSDVLVTIGVEDTIAAVAVGKDAVDFVELPTEGGAVHIRPSSVIAIIETPDPKISGFRAGR